MMFDFGYLIMRYCPKPLLGIVLLMHVAFGVTVVVYPSMAATDYEFWWRMFKFTFWACVGGWAFCYAAALVVRTKEILAPKRRANPLYNYRATDYVDVQLAATRLVEKARASARRYHNTDQEAALFLISMFETQRHEFAPHEQDAIRKVVHRAVQILQGE